MDRQQVVVNANEQVLDEIRQVTLQKWNIVDAEEVEIMRVWRK